jgi:histidine triad (HIT) family protein
MTSCAFCDYEDFKDQIIAEREGVYALQARTPIAPGHILLVPSIHIDTLLLDTKMSHSMFELGDFFRSIFATMHSATGVNLFTNIGRSAGQHIPHLHVHLISRREDEEINPFRILQDSMAYKSLHTLTTDEVRDRVEQYAIEYKKTPK